MISRTLAAVAAAIGIVASGSLAARADATQDRNAHREALLALDDIDAAISELNTSSTSTATNPEPYRSAAQRAANAIVGAGVPDYHSGAGNPGDAAGAMGLIGWLTAHAGTSVWGPALTGALVNLQAAAARLNDAEQAKELEDYWSATSRALQNLLVAAGRESGIGVLGGLRGALATTDLGVPANAQVVSGCSGPSAAPAYGVAKGYLIYVAIPSGPGATPLPETIGARDVSLHGNTIVVHTAAKDLLGKLCPSVQVAAATTAPPPASPPSDKPAALYTEEQARQGEQVYKQSCASCHGDELQGVSAPPVGGKRFMTKTKMLDWSVDDMRNLVLSSMPANNPRSLSDKQYADVLAYLLAVNCYPAGNTPFPTQSTPALKSAHLQPVQGAKGEDQKSNMCPVGR